MNPSNIIHNIHPNYSKCSITPLNSHYMYLEVEEDNKQTIINKNLCSLERKILNTKYMEIIKTPPFVSAIKHSPIPRKFNFRYMSATIINNSEPTCEN